MNNCTEITNMTDDQFNKFFNEKLSAKTKEALPPSAAIQKILDLKNYFYRGNKLKIRFVGFKVWEVGGKNWKEQVLDGVQERLDLDGIRAIHRVIELSNDRIEKENRSRQGHIDHQTSKRLNGWLRWQDKYFFENGYTD